MKVSEEALHRAGFTASDLKKIRNNVDSYGGTLGEAIQSLANRFKVVLWINLACIAVFLWVLFTHDRLYALSVGIGLLLTMLIVAFIQPPLLSFKSWRYWKKNRH
ncbi:hypothetical protein [Pantoea sp.]|uniref:hypothetical protein n=1 Tax=Pantoea sp. TaxID=69393 RepID=UPI0031DA7923